MLAISRITDFYMIILTCKFTLKFDFTCVCDVLIVSAWRNYIKNLLKLVPVLIRLFLAHWMSFFYEHDQVSIVGMKVAVLCVSLLSYFI